MDQSPLRKSFSKKITTLAVCCLLASPVWTTATAQGGISGAIDKIKANHPNARITIDDARGVVKTLSGVKSPSSGGSAASVAREFINRHKALFGVINADTELSVVKVMKTNHGLIVKLNQHYQGVEVAGGEIAVRITNKGVATVINDFQPDIAIDTTPAVSTDKAMAIAAAASKLADVTPSVTTMIVKGANGSQLAYRVDYPVQSEPEPTRYRIYVDAQSGKILSFENRIMHNSPAVGTGVGSDGNVHSFDTYLVGPNYYLGNKPLGNDNVTVKTYTGNNGTALPGQIMSDSDNHWDDPAAVDAHNHGNLTFDYFKDNFNDFSWYPGSGFQQSGGLISTVHHKVNYANAFWDGSQMVYGDGDADIAPLGGSIEIVAHEIAHGITEAINNLAYCKEPGALNESWSDIFGTLVSIENGDADPYLNGEDIMTIASRPGSEAYYAIRRLDDPTFRGDAYPQNDYDAADPLGSWGQPDHTSEQYIVSRCTPFNDNGGVHINSGIPNKAAHLIIEGIGANKAGQIYYLSMFYLSSSAQFTDARAAVEQATVDLYGAGTELSTVQAAFSSVGIL